MGLDPAVYGSWIQAVPLQKAVTNETASSLVLTLNGKEQELADAKGYILSTWFASPAGKGGSKAESDVSAPSVFVGFGVTAPDQKYDDYAGVDVRGKIVVGFYGAPSTFPSTERAYYSDGIVKAKNAVVRGAVGVVSMMIPEDWKRYPWEWLVPQIQAGEMHWLDKNGTPHDFFPELRGNALLSQPGGELLFAGAPKTLDQAVSDARAGKPQAFAMPVGVRIHTVAAQSVIQSANIVANSKVPIPLSATSPWSIRRMWIISASAPQSRATRSVTVPSTMPPALRPCLRSRAYASLPQPPRRSVVFAFVTGEEMGLLGSDYFAHFPTVPLKSIVANVNIDGAPGVYFPLQDVVALGAEHSTLDGEVAAAGKVMGYDVSPDPMPEEVSFIRSDQYSFVLQGVPAVDIEDGVKSTDPKINGLEVIKKWGVTRYHTPLDNMEQPIDFDAAAKGAVMNFLVGYQVAQHDRVPSWNKRDFFGTTFGLRHAGTNTGE